MATVLASATTSSANRLRFLITFNFVMALLMAVVVIYGFSHTIGANLIHPSIPRPRVLYVHAALFSVFMAIYILQTWLVAAGNVKLHQRLGPIWVVIGAAVPVFGIATEIVMRRFDVIHFNDYATFIAVILWDMLAFSTLLLFAVLWRKRPEYHRRLMFLVTCGLMDAGFSRFPLIALTFTSVPNFWADFRGLYVGVIALMLIAMTRDLIVQRRVHIVYRVAVPLTVAGQLLAVPCLMFLPPSGPRCLVGWLESAKSAFTDSNRRWQTAQEAGPRFDSAPARLL